MTEHLNDDQLIDQLYGLSENRLHFENCDNCARRFAELRERRAMVASPAEMSWERLAAQRRAIYSRLGESPRKQMRWVPALAAGCLLVIGAFFYRPAQPAHQDSGDAQLFSDVYSIEQSTEPLAAAPIHELFEDNQ
jgi:hypothetical protein